MLTSCAEKSYCHECVAEKNVQAKKEWEEADKHVKKPEDLYSPKKADSPPLPPVEEQKDDYSSIPSPVKQPTGRSRAGRVGRGHPGGRAPGGRGRGEGRGSKGKQSASTATTVGGTTANKKARTTAAATSAGAGGPLPTPIIEQEAEEATPPTEPQQKAAHVIQSRARVYLFYLARKAAQLASDTAESILAEVIADSLLVLTVAEKSSSEAEAEAKVLADAAEVEAAEEEEKVDPREEEEVPVLPIDEEEVVVMEDESLVEEVVDVDLQDDENEEDDGEVEIVEASKSDVKFAPLKLKTLVEGTSSKSVSSTRSSEHGGKNLLLPPVVVDFQGIDCIGVLEIGNEPAASPVATPATPSSAAPVRPGGEDHAAQHPATPTPADQEGDLFGRNIFNLSPSVTAQESKVMDEMYNCLLKPQFGENVRRPSFLFL
jgi:hypothetical protein